MENKRREIIYIEKSLFNEMILKSLIILSFIMVIYFFNPLISKKLIIIINIVIIFSIMFFSIITFSFSENGFFTISAICYILIGILKIIELINHNGESRSILDITKLIETIYIFVIARYFRGSFGLIEKRVKEKKLDFILAILSIVIFILYYANYKGISSYYYKILIVFIFCYIIYYISRFPFKIKNKINYFSLVIMVLFISNGISLLGFSNKSFIEMIVEGCSFFAYFLIYSAFSYKLLNKPSENVFTELNNRKEMLIEINNEITNKNLDLERKQIKLKNDENIFKSIYMNIAIPLAIVNEKYRIVYVNNKFKEIIEEIDCKKIINQNIFKFIDITESLNGFKETRESTCIIENVIIKKRKSKIFNVNMIKKENREDILIFHDITREIKIEKIRKNYEKKILEEKMKNDFLSNISHDIKAPINVIYSALQLENMLIEENKLEELKKYNYINKENILAISRLANNLIDSSKLSNNYLNPNMEIVNIVEVIEDSCNYFVEYIKNKKLKFYFDTEKEEIYIKCDRELIERIVINIISNSIKNTFKGEITVNIYLKNKKVIIEFKDTGVGIKKELIETVFDKYSIGHNGENEISKNTGIGLYVVQNLVKIQKGKIKLNSKENMGTIIELEFFLEFINEGLNYDAL